MAVNFRIQKKIQKYLVITVISIIIITAGVLWFGFFKKEAPAAAVVSQRMISGIDINFDVLSSPFLLKAKSFEGIPDFQGKAGRENPFLPY